MSRKDDGAGWEPKWTTRISEARSFKSKKEAEAYIRVSLPEQPNVEVVTFAVEFVLK